MGGRGDKREFERRQLSYIFRQMIEGAIADLPMTADYIRLSLRLGLAQGLATSAILADTQLTEAEITRPGALATQRDNLLVLSNMTRHLGAGWFMRLGVRLGAETTGPLGQAVTMSPTVRDAFKTMETYGQSRSPRFRLRLVRHGRADMALEIMETMILPEEMRMTGDEGIMLSLQGMIETLVETDIARATFCFRTPEPPHGSLYLGAFRGQVRFGCLNTGITFPGEWLERPGPFANPILFAAAIEALEAERLALENHGLAAAEVEQRLALGPGGAAASLPDIAKQLHVSVRTLERRLQEAGTSFRAIRDKVLARRARTLLEKTSRTIGSISEELGYSDPVAFNLACHRWFGASPRAVRLESQEKPTAER